MCGILGQVELRDGRVAPERFDAMRDTLRHRGPEDSGSWRSADGRIALGHRRLSLVDLSPAGRQPLGNETGDLWLTLNGEIYNHLPLRRELESRGHRFASGSDAEVVVHGYEEWGLELLPRLRGMFAFGLWDEERRRLLLARDRFGIKPLFFYRDAQRFLFASELKAIVAHPEVRREIDPKSLCDYLIYRFVPSPGCIWKNMGKLAPAQYMLLEGDELSDGSYWELPAAEKVVPEDEAAEQLDALLADSVREHLLGDVPIGSFLSGGYDSSSLVYHMHRLGRRPQTFSIGFEDWPESEHRYARRVAERFETEHRSWLLGAESLALMDKMAEVYDEPIGDISTVPTYAVSSLASRHTKAVLSGEGADEIFAGYWWHRGFFQQEGEQRSLIDHHADAVAMGGFEAHRLRSLLGPELQQGIPDDPLWFHRSQLREDLPPLKQLQHLDLRSFCGELVLTKVDRASMAHSLELRVPFLDHRLVELLFSWHPQVYFRSDVQKLLLRRTVEHALPSEVIERSKQGFVGPDRYYMDIDLYAGLLREGRLIRDGMLQREPVERLIQLGDHWRLWKLAVLEHWVQRWLP